MSPADGAAGLPAVLDAFPGLVARADRQGRLMAANRRWREQFDGEVVGRSLASCLDSSSQDRWERSLAGPAAGGHLVELVLEGRHGAAPVNLFVFPEGDGPDAAIWLVENPAANEGFRFLAETSAIISEMAALHRDLGLEKQRVETALDRERAANDLAQQALKERDQVLAFVAHDLKSPLSVIDLRAEFLLAILPHEGATAAIREGLSVIRDSVQRMSRLIADLLDRAALATGRLNLRRKRLDGAELVQKALVEMGPKAARVDVTLAVDLAPDLPPIDGDADRLHRVLVNLLDNAIRVSPAGSVVTVGVAPVDGNVRFTVRDDGPGLDEAGMSRLFSPFALVTSEPAAGSTGLGLSICKAIVEAHGGTISACCGPGNGCTFTFTVPVAVGLSGWQTA
jgi:signal transduction histidine kinase